MTLRMQAVYVYSKGSSLFPIPVVVRKDKVSNSHTLKNRNYLAQFLWSFQAIQNVSHRFDGSIMFVPFIVNHTLHLVRYYLEAALRMYDNRNSYRRSISLDLKGSRNQSPTHHYVSDGIQRQQHSERPEYVPLHR